MQTESRDRTALLVIDVQQGLFEKSHPIYQEDELLGKINALVEAAHRAGVPVFYVQHCDQTGLIEGSQPWKLHPGLRPLETDTFIFKEISNSFEGTDLDEKLKSMNVNHVVVTGLVTHGCVKNSCLGAKELGYRVTLVKDAHSNFSTDAARVIEKWNAKLGDEAIELRSASEVSFH